MACLRDPLESPFAKVLQAIEILNESPVVEEPGGVPWYMEVREYMKSDPLLISVLSKTVEALEATDPEEKHELWNEVHDFFVQDELNQQYHNGSQWNMSYGFIEPANPMFQHKILTPPKELGPVGTCSIFGDPHVMGFDHTPIKPALSLLDVGSSPAHKSSQQDSIGVQGDFWLVRNPLIHIQGRFNKVEEGRLFLRGLAVSGPFVQGNVLLISGNTGGKVWWNKEQILNGAPSEFSRDSLIFARHRTERLVQDPSRKAELPGYDMQFPLGLKLLVNRGSRGLGVKITMPKLPGHQDGQCGNFNGDGKDDTAELISGRIASEDLLFRHSYTHVGVLPYDGNWSRGLERTCSIFGDPHFIGFDNNVEMSQNISGDFWMLKHDLIQIQGRFFQEDNITNRSYLKKVAIGGPLLEGNTLFIGKRGNQVSWNNEAILSSIPSEFSNNFIHAKYHNHFKNPFPKIEIELPLGIKLMVNRGKHVLGMKITVPKELTEDIDGQCGSARAVEVDDTETQTSMRVQPFELLFHRVFHLTSDSSSEDEHNIL